MDLRDVWKLTRDEYNKHDYLMQTEVPQSHYPKFDNCEYTYIKTINNNDELVGTISLTLDSELGLPTDDYFKEEADVCRRKYKKIGCLWRLVTKYHKNIVFLLLDQVYKWWTIYNLDCILFEINPKHIDFYRDFAGAEVISEIKENKKMNDKAILCKLTQMDTCKKNRKRVIRNG